MSATLRDLLARRTPVEWFEAVAIVQALCKRLLDEAPAAGVRVPDLHQIVLGADGTIDVTGKGPEGQSAVFRAGEVLTAIIGDHPMPVPLRLVALSAVSPSPPYDSLPALTAALDYHERPNRSAILRAVFERYQQLPAAPDTAAPIAEIPAAPARQAGLQTPAWWKRHRALVAAGLALVLTAAAAGAFVTLRPKLPWVAEGATQVVELAGATSDAVAKTVSSGVDALRARLGGPSASDVAAAAEPPPLTPVPKPPRPTRALLPSTSVWLKPGGTTASAPPTAPTVAPDWPLDAALIVDPPPLPAPAVEPGDWTIYSAENLDVVAPVSIRPIMPSEPPPGVRPETLPLLELLVSAGGEVESVRLRALSSDIRTSMMLSAVKAWRFQPATRNGHPVRYRYLLRLTSAD